MAKGTGSWIMAVAASMAQNDPDRLKERLVRLHVSDLLLSDLSLALLKSSQSQDKAEEYSNQVQIKLFDPTTDSSTSVELPTDSNYDMDWDLFGKSLWPKMLAKGIQGRSSSLSKSVSV